jgi:hypothetical protein
VRHESGCPKTKKAGERERPGALSLTGLRCDGPTGCTGLPLDSSSANCSFVGRKQGFFDLRFPSDMGILRDKRAKASKPCGNPRRSSPARRQTAETTPTRTPLERVFAHPRGRSCDPVERSRLRCAVRLSVARAPQTALPRGSAPRGSAPWSLMRLSGSAARPTPAGRQSDFPAGTLPSPRSSTWRTTVTRKPSSNY